MKKVLFPILALVLALGLALPMATQIAAVGTTMTVVSDTDTMVTWSTGGIMSPQKAKLAWVHSNWWTQVDKSYKFRPSGAKWIWESYWVVNTIAGDIVYFEKTFFIPGGPTGGILYITCDNGYEAYLNGESIGSAQLGPDWETSNLTQSYVNTNNWQSVESWDITSVVQPGENVLFIKAANEYMGPLDGQSKGTTYSNPAGLIFEVEITYRQVPSIAIEKSGPDYAHEGDTITYTYTVTNDGDFPLSDVTVTDSLGMAAKPVLDSHIHNIGDTNDNGLLDLDETWTFTARYTVPAPCAGPVMNEATATGEYEGERVTDTDSWSVDILHPSITVVKSADKEFAASGDTVTYHYTVTNTGDCDLYNVLLEDDVLGTIQLSGLENLDGDGVANDLAQGKSASGTASHELSLDDPEDWTNTATTSGSDILKLEVTDEDSWRVRTEGMGARTIGYWKTHPDEWCELGTGSIFYPVFDNGDNVREKLLSYFPGKGAQKGGVNPLEMLRAQLLAAELNVACFDTPFDYSRYEAADIYGTIRTAEALLQRVYAANGENLDDLDIFWSGLSKRQQRSVRQEAQPLKDVLEAFNAMGDDIFG